MNKRKVSHETVVFIGDHPQPDPKGYMTLRYQWQDTDYRGLKLVKPFFGMSVDGGRFIDVETVVERWENRNNIAKPNEVYIAIK